MISEWVTFQQGGHMTMAPLTNLDQMDLNSITKKEMQKRND